MWLWANVGMSDHTFEKNWSRYFPLLTVCNHVKQDATEWAPLTFNSLFGYAWVSLTTSTQNHTSICTFNRHEPACKKNNFITLILFEILKFKKPENWLAESIFAVNHAHLKLHDQFAALIDMKLQAKNQLYTSITVFEISKFSKTLWAELGIPDHTHLSIHNLNKYEAACTKSTSHLLFLRS